jgi:hypothetical protein
MLLLLGLYRSAAASGVPERHDRLHSHRGPIHVWSPAGYDRATAATVVFIHGYFTTVDVAWTRYHLAAQFRASGINALFIACEAPTSQVDPVSWRSLDDLLSVVAAGIGRLPEGRLVIVGHSGAHRTLAGWLDEPRADTLALVDAAYNDPSVYRAWLEARPGRRLIDVGDVRRAVTDAFHRDLPDTVVVERFPAPEQGTLSPNAQDARVVYVRSFMGHMRLVSGGVAIPLILRALEAPLVGGLDRAAAIPRPVGT